MRILCAASLLSVFAVATASADETITLNVAGEFAGQPFSCANTYQGVGTTDSTVEVTDYRLFISEIALIAADGSRVPLALQQDGAWQFGAVALLDFEDGTGPCANGTTETNTAIVGSVPPGDYKGVTLTVGVPFDLNHGDPTLASSPLNLTAMFWNWRGGYKFVKLDMATAGLPVEAVREDANHEEGMPAQATARGWSLHLGSTMCASASRTTPPTECQNPNRVEVSFEEFDPATNVIVIDPAPVVAAANVDENAPDTSPGCMSFPDDLDCATVMPRLGLAYNGAPAEPQQLIRMR